MRLPAALLFLLASTTAPPPAEAAVYSLTGIETRPNEIVPDPSACGGMAGALPGGENI